MNSSKKIRETLGLSQQQLADYLSVTRSCISMAESGLRSLPTHALLKLGQLSISLQNNWQPPPQTGQKQATKDRAAIKAHVKECQFWATQCKNKLTQLQATYGQCMQTLGLTHHLLNNLPTGKQAAKDRLWLEVLQLDTAKKLKQCGHGAQAMLQLRIQSLEQEAAAAEKMQF